jgi:hypothetical protein
MKAIRIHEFGGAEKLRLEEIKKREFRGRLIEKRKGEKADEA